MEKKVILYVVILSFVMTSVLSLTRCTADGNRVYLKLRNHADQIRVINTHEHQHWPEEYGDHKFSFYHQICLSYLMSDLNSAGASGYDWSQLDTLIPEELWHKYGKALDYCRNTSYYGYVIRGYKKLYGFNDSFFTEENVSALMAQVEEKYKDYHLWFDEAFHKAGYELMFLDRSWRDWNKFNDDVNKQYFAPVFNISSLVSQAGRRPAEGQEFSRFYKEAIDGGYEFKDLDDYLAYCDHLFEKNIDKAVCLKNALTYSRTLYYEDVSYEEASALFSKASVRLTPPEVKKIEDFMFHWIIRKSIKYNLPVQIHTGYLTGNGNILEYGKPVRLNNLFLQYPEAKFIIFHGSFPWTGEFAALGKMFPNVYLDLVWLPQISRQEAVHALDVILDCVPYNKIFWGGDCNLIEGSVGALEFAKDVVAEVLAGRVKRGLLTEEVALEIIDRIFRENAIEVFKLDDRLLR